MPYNPNIFAKFAGGLAKAMSDILKYKKRIAYLANENVGNFHKMQG